MDICSPNGENKMKDIIVQFKTIVAPGETTIIPESFLNAVKGLLNNPINIILSTLRDILPGETFDVKYLPEEDTCVITCNTEIDYEAYNIVTFCLRNMGQLRYTNVKVMGKDQYVNYYPENFYHIFTKGNIKVMIEITTDLASDKQKGLVRLLTQIHRTNVIEEELAGSQPVYLMYRVVGKLLKSYWNQLNDNVVITNDEPPKVKVTKFFDMTALEGCYNHLKTIDNIKLDLYGNVIYRVCADQRDIELLQNVLDRYISDHPSRKIISFKVNSTTDSEYVYSVFYFIVVDEGINFKGIHDIIVKHCTDKRRYTKQHKFHDLTDKLKTTHYTDATDVPSVLAPVTIVELKEDKDHLDDLFIELNEFLNN